MSRKVFFTIAAAVFASVANGGALWLQSGRVVQGTVTRSGSAYVVQNAEGRHVFPVPGVLLVGESVTDLYRQLAATHRAPEDRLQLAEWCLDNGLQAQGLEQLRKLGPGAKADPKIAALYERAEKIEPAAAPTLDEVEPRQRAYGLSSETVGLYRSRIAPLLKNGCGSAKCHGPATARPLSFSVVAKPDDIRAVLGETLRQLDPLDPAESPLVRKAVAAHGGAKRPAIHGRYAESQTRRLLEFASAASAEMKLPTKRR